MAAPTISVSVSHDFTASQERVFNAWLDTNQLTQWMFGPKVREEEIIHLHTDARSGGAFSFKVRRGADEINHIGTYLEITPYSKLVFTWGIEGETGDESVVTIDITPAGSGCHLELTHVMDRKWQEYSERTVAGWSFMLEKLAELG